MTMWTTLLIVWTAACVGPDRAKRAAAKVDLGAAYLREGDIGSAIGTLEQATKQDPRNWSGWQKLALAYSARGAHEKADVAFRRSLRLIPKSAEVNNNYGLALLGQNRLDDAIERFEVAAQDLTYRKPALVLNNLGYALYLKGDLEGAQRRLDEAVQRAPNMCQARFHRALVHEALTNTDKALADFSGVIEMCGEEAPGAWYHTASLQFARGERDEGCQHLQTVLDLADTGRDLGELTQASQELFLQECAR